MPTPEHAHTRPDPELALDPARLGRDKWTMGDPLDFIDEGGWPYPDDDVDVRSLEPIDLRSATDDDAVALHALAPHALAALTDLERAAVAARFGLAGQPPMTMVELRSALGVSRNGARLALSGGLDKLRAALGDGAI